VLWLLFFVIEHISLTMIFNIFDIPCHVWKLLLRELVYIWLSAINYVMLCCDMLHSVLD